MISPFYKSQKNGFKIQIFKTNIKTKLELNSIKVLLNSNSSILNWSIDLEDIDKVLRVESQKNLSEKDVINLIKSGGFHCEELN
ncbi:hypothetical protein [Winogradskyella luteola]|uniref:HMA domain-containing protein n=1 Tax=Winogradskyella luteola TaxID=2828330 RepID=A0A9X1JNS5_9FLAO|nr:hypothetical protein [Winogradskyella luteola]MBV7267969.1 hypothetical protein [Winogradskyella luteola]